MIISFLSSLSDPFEAMSDNSLLLTEQRGFITPKAIKKQGNQDDHHQFPCLYEWPTLLAKSTNLNLSGRWRDSVY